MKKILSGFLWVFYVAIILYVFFAVLNINTLENCASALIFEIIGFVILAYCIFYNMCTRPIKVGYFVPVVMTTVVYTIVLDVINIAFITSVSSVIFTLIHLIVLFAYCLVSIPMYLMGRR
jgi:hypothetical protein